MKLSNKEIIKFHENGYIKETFFNQDQCKEFKLHFDYLSNNYQKLNLNGKFKDRIMNPHFFDKKSREIILMSTFFSYSIQLIKSEVFGVQTMYFKWGSEQNHHQDDFYLNKTIGFWIALENVDEFNGSICVQKSSQKYDVVYPEDLGIKNPQHLGNDDRYSEKILEIYKKNKNKLKLNDKIVSLEKGEGLILDGRLIHWGLPIKNTKKRRVFVIHYLQKNSRWPYKNWPLFQKNGEYKVDGIFNKNNLHPNEI